MSKTQRIYLALKRGARLTMATGFTRFKSTCLHKRISEIEDQHGITIKRRKIKRNGREITQWSLK